MTKNLYIQIKGILKTIDEAIEHIRSFEEEDYESAVSHWMKELRYAVENINLKLLDCPKVSFCDLDYLEFHMKGYGQKEELIREYKQWEKIITQVLANQYSAVNIWDEKFVKLMDYALYVDSDTIIKNTKCSLYHQDDRTIQKLCAYYQNFGAWGILDVKNSRYDVIQNRVTELKEHREDFLWLYECLEDWRSKLVLTSILCNWMTFDTAYILGMKEGNYTDYFDLDLIPCDEQEVVVDLGAWTGDTVLNYIQTYGKYKKIYCYEIDSDSVEKMKKCLSEYPDIEYRNKGVGKQNKKGYLSMGAPDSSCNKVVDYATEREIEIVRLDDDIDEKITLIKMDIEGAEQDALSGCMRHIREESPRLLISVYHNNEDIWKIPRMIFEMNSDYQFYLRSNGKQWGPAEIILIAVPKETCIMSDPI